MYQILVLYLHSFCRYVRVYAKMYGITWPRPRPFSGTPKFFFLGGGRDLGTPLFWIFLCGFLRYCPCAPVYQISSLYLYSFWRYVRVYAKIYGVTWDLGHAPFMDFSLRVFEILPVHLCTKFQVSSSTRFVDTLGCTPKFLGVTWPRPRPFSGFSLWFFVILPLCICVPNFKSLSLLVLEIC